MSLRSIAEADLALILEDGVYGFGWDISVEDPDGNTGELVGFSNDISQLIDPDTGQAVSGRLASAVLRISSLSAEGLGIPTQVSDANSKPWVIEFSDINGVSYRFKVSESNPDRALGIVVCLLELYA